MGSRATLLAVIMGSFVVGVDATVLNVALPSISRELGGGLAGQQWTLDAYLLVLGAFMLPGGSLGDLFGQRRVFAVGLAGFGAGSLLCALAPSIAVLVVARAVQGLAGAILTPASLAVIVACFSGEQRGAAIGTWTAWSGIAMVVGPLLGGEILSVASWRWVFAINVPFVLLTLALVPRLPAARLTTHPPLDAVGAALAVAGLAGPVFALIEGPRLGFSHATVLVPGLGGAALLALFVRWEGRRSDPMVPLSLFGRRNFAAGNLETLSLYGGLGAFIFFLALFLQQVAGYTPLQSGLATVPTTLVMFSLSRLFGRLAGRFGFRRFMGGGPLLAAAGIFLLLRLGARVAYVSDLLPAVLVFALGLAMTVAPLTAGVLADVEPGRAGIGSAINNTVARVAALLSTAAIGAAVSARFSSVLEGHHLPGLAAAVRVAERTPLAVRRAAGLVDPAARVLRAAETAAAVSAFHLAVVVIGTLVLLGGVIGLGGIRDRAGGSAVAA